MSIRDEVKRKSIIKGIDLELINELNKPMSRITKYIKRGAKYILKGQPVVKVTPQFVELAPNKLLKGWTAFITG